MLDLLVFLKVLRPFLLRRLKVEVEKQLPKKYEHVVMCRLSKRQRYLYDDFMSRAKTKETLSSGNLLSVINVLMQLRKVCNHPNLFEVRPIISPFQMECITYHTASLDLDLSFLNMRMVDLELFLTAFVAHRIKKFRANRSLFQQLEVLPASPRCPSGKIKINIRVSNNTPQQQLVKALSIMSPRVGTSPVVRTIAPQAGDKSIQFLDYSSPVASLVLADSSQPTSDRQYLGGVTLRRSVGTPLQGHSVQLVQHQAEVKGSTRYFILPYPGDKLMIGFGIPVTALATSQHQSLSVKPTNVQKISLPGFTLVHTSVGPQLLLTTSSQSHPVQGTTTEELRRKQKQDRLNLINRLNQRRCDAYPIYGPDLVETLRLVDRNVDKSDQWRSGGYMHCRHIHYSLPRNLGIYWTQTDSLRDCVKTLQQRMDVLADIFSRFILCVPAVLAPLPTLHVSHPSPSKLWGLRRSLARMQKELSLQMELLHPIMSAMATQFPDPRLIQYDCGKLQVLDKLLRQLKVGHHRVLIFTQMTRMLDVLEAFLNHHGHIYLRLDGSTRVDQRQMLMERFNADPRIFCFILSTRSGGIGVNLTGADTVIFYDSDWNPTMDAQAQDRCHRIGQTRDVHIYSFFKLKLFRDAFRLVSEMTVEENILKKANQKRLLGDLAIEGGNFTTAYFKSTTIQDLFNIDVNEQNASRRMAEVLDGESERENRRLNNEAQTSASVEEKVVMGVLESALAAAEDDTDVQAARTAKAEAAAELAEFDESIPLEDGASGEGGAERSLAEPEISRAELEVRQLVDQLTPVERYAMRFMEETEATWSAEQLAAAEAEIEQQKHEWEMGRLRALQDEEERRARLTDEDDVLLTFSSEDAHNQVNTGSGRARRLRRRHSRTNSTTSEDKLSSTEEEEEDSSSSEELRKARLGISKLPLLNNHTTPRQSPRTRSRGSVRINLWRLDMSSELTDNRIPVAPPPQTSTPRAPPRGAAPGQSRRPSTCSDYLTDPPFPNPKVVIRTRRTSVTHGDSLWRGEPTPKKSMDRIVTDTVENENDQKDLHKCMNETVFNNCNAEGYTNIDNNVQTEPDTMDIHALEGDEEGNDIVLEEEKFSVKTYQDAFKSLKKLQQFALQQNDSDMLSMISQAKLFVESSAAKRMWCPPTPPQNDNDVYMDQSLGFLYEQTIMSESQLPPVYIKKELKRRLDLLPMADREGRRPIKVRHKEESMSAPRSLFDRPSSALARMRRDMKLQKCRGIVRPPLPIPGLKPPTLLKPAPEPENVPEWAVYEDWAILQAVQSFQELPLNLMILSPGHTPNWDMVSDMVNTVSRVYRSPKQCRNSAMIPLARYESVIIPREEGKLLFDPSPKKQKKTKGGMYKFPSQTKTNRPMRTSQLYMQDNNLTSTQIFVQRFDAIKSVSNKRTPTVKPLLANPSVKNPKHAAVLAENNINIDCPLTPVEIAARRAERILKEKQKSAQASAAAAQALSAEQQLVLQRLQQQQQPLLAGSRTVSSVPAASTTPTTQQTVVVSTMMQTSTVATLSPALRPQRPVATLTVQEMVSPRTVTGSPTVVSVASLVPAVQMQAAAQRLATASLVSQASAPGIAVSQSKGIAVTTAGKTTLSATQLQYYRQQALIRHQQQQRMREQHLKAMQAQGQKLSVAVTTSAALQQQQQQQQQQRAQLIKQAAAGGIARTVTESEMAALIKRQQQQQQQHKAAASGQVSQVQVPVQAGLTPAQILAQAGLQVQQASQAQVATLVKAVSSPGMTLPQVRATLSPAGVKTAGNPSQTHQIRQLALHQHIMQRKLPPQLSQVAGKGGLPTQLIMQSPKTLPTTVTMQQIQHVIKSVQQQQNITHVSGAQAMVSQTPGGQVISHAVLTKSSQAPAGSRVIPVSTSHQQLKQTIQVVTAAPGVRTSVPSVTLDSSGRSQVTTASTLASALAGIKVAPSVSTAQHQAIISQVNAALQAQQQQALRQANQRLQAPLMAVTVQSQQQAPGPPTNPSDQKISHLSLGPPHDLLCPPTSISSISILLTRPYHLSRATSIRSCTDSSVTYVSAADHSSACPCSKLHFSHN
uniref:Helicase C-terminal domain-containing protein n=1 Tax=Timema monikensis TaxID=170555 RepID=A0A7R9E2K7_9NEOP|nr:unnamed protein product [Timema monikensis]